MLCPDIYIAGTGASIPDAIPVEVAIANGRYSRQEADRSQQLAATAAPPGQPPPDLAVAAAEQALARSGHSPTDLATILYAVVLDTGRDVWNSASYVQRQLGIPGGPSLVSEVRSACDGGGVSLQLACSHLLTHPAQPAALVTAADCWHEPAFDRWRADSNCVYGDCGAAVVLARAHGLARLLSICTHTDPALEGTLRGDEPFRPCLDTTRYPIDIRRRVQEFSRTMPDHELWQRIQAGPRVVAQRVTAEAGVDPRHVKHVALPFLGLHVLEPSFLQPLGIAIDRTTFQYGRRIGHTGAGDPLAGIHHLIDSGRLAPGDRALVITSGGGFIWTAALIQATYPSP